MWSYEFWKSWGKIWKKKIFIKDFDLNCKKIIYKGVIYVIIIYRDIEYVEKINIIIELEESVY